MRVLVHLLGDIRDSPTLSAALIIVVAIAGFAAGNYLIRRAADPGPLARGEARWRYRTRPMTERLAGTLSSLVPRPRTTGWWATRIEFALAIAAATMAVVAWMFFTPTEPIFGRAEPSREVVWLAQLAIGAVGILIGLAWMVRIYRAPLRIDSKAYWRYHDGA